MNVYEMEGFLRGKCIPRDILVNESTAAYLVRKLNEATAVKAERDALAVENAGLKSLSIKLFNLGYLHGHESTVEGYFVDVHRNDIDTYHDDVVAEILEDEDETPSTSAALAAIEARGVEKFAEATIAIGEQEKEESIIYAGKQAMLFAKQLREGK